MATSPNTGSKISESPLRSTLAGLPDLSRYDAVLAAIPLVFALVFSAHALVPLSFRLASAADSAVSRRSPRPQGARASDQSEARSE